MRFRIVLWAACLAASVLGCGDDVEGPSVMSTCEDFCGLAAECDLPMSGTRCVATCESDIEGAFDFRQACGRALQTRYECVDGLDCAGFRGWLDEEPEGDYPCRAEERAVDVACGG